MKDMKTLGGWLTAGFPACVRAAVKPGFRLRKAMLAMQQRIW